MRTARVTIWTSGPFCVQALFGSGKSPFGSATQPPRLCCLWRVNSTADPSTTREKCTAWWSAPHTATGKQWRASSWNPARLDPGISAVHYTPSFRETLHTSWICRTLYSFFTHGPRRGALSCYEKEFNNQIVPLAYFLNTFILHIIRYCSKVWGQ